MAEKVTGSDRTAARGLLSLCRKPYVSFLGRLVHLRESCPSAGSICHLVDWANPSGRRSSRTGCWGHCDSSGCGDSSRCCIRPIRLAWRLVAHRARNAKALRRARDLGLVVIVSSAATLVWFLAVARPAFSYLVTQNLSPGLRQTGSLIAGNTAPRKLYSSGGYVSPAWQRFAGFAGLGVILLVIPPGLYLAWRQRTRAPMVIAMAVTVAFPLSLIPRLTPIGIAISGRSSEFIFAGLGCVLGLLVSVEFWPRRHQHSVQKLRTWLAGWRGTALATGLIILVFVGEVTIGTASYQLLPEASRPAGYPWTVQPDAIAASVWSRRHLGTNQRFGADKLDSFALASYGEQNIVSENSVWPIFFALKMDSNVVNEVKQARIRYLLVDERMTKGVPPTPGYYFSPEEPLAGLYLLKFPQAGLQKFDSTPCMRLVFHSGEVKIFDMSKIEDGSCVPSEAPGSGGR